jgi:two-component system OmpR family sensor kinase
MSSNPRSRQWSLRARLLIGLIGLLAAAGVGTAGVNQFTLERELTAQLDQRLRDNAERASYIHGSTLWRYRAQSDPAALRRGTVLDAPGQPIGLLAAVIDNGVTVDGGVLRAGGVRDDVSAAAGAQIAEAAGDRNPVTRSLDGLGRYRTLATRSRVTGQTLVIGLSMGDLDRTMVSATWTAAGMLALTLVLMSGAGFFVIRRALAPLDQVVATAGEVAGLPLHREPEILVRVATGDLNPTTEVGKLQTALDRMLDHIAESLATRQASEDRMRQFAADASHELRTPLAVVRGYAELLQRRRAEVPADVAAALERLDHQAVRMTDLVEDLLLLARLDSGRPLRREPVDLTKLCAEAVSDARAASPDHRWSLALPSGPVYVTGDESRLYLSLANLLSNARVHTPPGTSVQVSLIAEAGTAVVRVLDDGPGIPAAMQSEVFGRFTRADPSRSRAGGSTGLGLAIVSAVAGAHGGSVTVRSVPGLTEFTLRLPIADG